VIFGTAFGATAAPPTFFDPATSSLLTSIGPLLAKVQKYLPTIVNIAEDPALPIVVNKIQALRNLELKARSDAAAAHATPPGPPGPPGIGLWRVAGALDAYIWTRQHPWAFRGIVASSVLGLIGIGFGLGRLSKRS